MAMRHGCVWAAAELLRSPVIVGFSGIQLPDPRRSVAERLAYYKVPAHWRVTETPLTRTATGKVVRTSLAV